MARAGKSAVMGLCSALAWSCGRLGFDRLPPPGGDGTINGTGGGLDAAVATGGSAGAGGGTGGTGAGGMNAGGRGTGGSSAGGMNASGGGGTSAGGANTGGTRSDAGPDSGTNGPPTMSDLCTFDRITIIADGNVNDDATSASLAATIRTKCGTTPTTRTVNQDDPGILASNGRPLLPPNELGVTAGGPSNAQRVVQYLDIADTPLVLVTSRPGTYQLNERATGQPVVRVMGSTLGPTHDYALVMVVKEPISGSTIVSAYARGTPGTSAGPYWFSNLAPRPIASMTERWDLIEWTNGDGNPVPSAGDTFILTASR